jgi:hypothetical protein
LFESIGFAAALFFGLLALFSIVKTLGALLRRMRSNPSMRTHEPAIRAGSNQKGLPFFPLVLDFPPTFFPLVDGRFRLIFFGGALGGTVSMPGDSVVEGSPIGTLVSAADWELGSEL